MSDYIDSYVGFAAPDLEIARGFYRDKLGLTVTDDAMGQLVVELPGGPSVVIYDKPNHVPATYTILNLIVEDIEAGIDDLTARGIEMVQYEGFNQDARGISRDLAPDSRLAIAWFTDPAGNIISIQQHND